MIHTFVIPAYGDSEHLEECINSLKNQTTQSAIMITTSTPSENLKNLADKYAVEYIVNPLCGGIAADWNFAFNSARTKYVTLAHQDDIYLTGYAETCIGKAESSSDTLIVFSDYSELNGGKTVNNSMKVLFKKLLLFPFYLNSAGYRSRFVKKIVLSFGCPVCCPTVFFNKENLKDFTFGNGYAINLDWDAWIRMAEEGGRFIYNKTRTVVHRVHEGSETAKNLEKRKEEDKQIFRKLWFFPLSSLISFFYRLSYLSFK